MDPVSSVVSSGLPSRYTVTWGTGVPVPFSPICRCSDTTADTSVTADTGLTMSNSTDYGNNETGIIQPGVAGWFLVLHNNSPPGYISLKYFNESKDGSVAEGSFGYDANSKS